MTGLKTHSKTALVVRQEEGGDPLLRAHRDRQLPRPHGQALRGRRAADCDPAVTGDVVTLFHFLTGRSRTPSFTNLVVAPMNMRAEFARLIEREIANHEAG